MTVARICGTLPFAVAIALASPAPAHAQSYPTRPIKLIVPFPAGGPVDIMARLIADKLSSTIGQVIVENRPGGGGTVGFKAAVNADPDGHTLLYNGLMALSVVPALSRSFEADAKKGFAPVAVVSSVPFVLTVAPRIPATTVPELIAHARANPGRLNFGAPIGATPQLVGELFKRKAGIEFVTIPYKGAANTMTDMLSGQIDMAFEPQSIFKPDDCTISIHRGASSLSRAAKSCGEPPAASAPSFCSASRMSGDASAALMARLSVATISAGVPPGATIPVRDTATTSGTPLSITVGRSGR
jgi:hypothetical protein